MRTAFLTSAICTAACVAVALGCTNASNSPSGADPDPSAGSAGPVARGGDADGNINPRLLRRFQPLTTAGSDASKNEPLVDLGHKLYFDPRLSKNDEVSCASCHDLAHGGVDGLPTSVGYGKQRGDRNAPTVLNAAGAFSQFWDGRSGTIEEQALGPILNPKEMGMPSGAAVVTRLRGIAGYAPLFKAAFPNEATSMTFDNVGRAIGAYERGLSTPGRWDSFLAGDKNALTAKEKDGLRTFLNVGCMVCHTGPLLGGATFERVGVVEPWPNQKDPGRMAVTHSAGDRMMFKVPTLRNVAKTAPYFHDGSGATLRDAVRLMGKHQLGLELTVVEVDAIATWLGALDGEVPAALAARPELPQ